LRVTRIEAELERPLCSPGHGSQRTNPACDNLGDAPYGRGFRLLSGLNAEVSTEGI
jgi:hypothetical protein